MQGLTDDPELAPLRPEVRGAIAAVVPMKREGTPEEVAYGVPFLTSNHAYPPFWLNLSSARLH